MSIDDFEYRHRLNVYPDTGVLRAFVQHQKPSELSCPTWTAAFEVGVTKLYHLAKDERIGPRTAGEDKDAAPVG